MENNFYSAHSYFKKILSFFEPFAKRATADHDRKDVYKNSKFKKITMLCYVIMMLSEHFITSFKNFIRFFVMNDQL